MSVTGVVIHDLREKKYLGALVVDRCRAGRKDGGAAKIRFEDPVTNKDRLPPAGTSWI